MIPVACQPEPATFDENVRQPGAAFLRWTPQPTNKDFKRHNYWQKALLDLQRAYGGICAYSAMWLHPVGSVDHFVPKSANPPLAYEWSNFRLTSERLNNYKADATDLIDPFDVQPGWFELDLATFFVRPGSGLPADLEAKIARTIETLRLNHDALVQQRFDIAKEYADGNVNLQYLLNRYPFIGSELLRNNQHESIKGTL